MKFKEHSNLNLPEINKSVLEDWDREDLFHKSMTEREGCPSYVFFEGPPSDTCVLKKSCCTLAAAFSCLMIAIDNMCAARIEP